MISIVCSTREIKKEFESHILKMCGIKDIQFLHYENKGEFSLTELYNKGLDESVYDIVLFLHDDMEIVTTNFGNKILKHFDRHPDLGILGVAGTTCLDKSGKWWTDPKKMVGRVDHQKDGKGNKWTSSYSADQGNQLKPVVLVDGVFFAVNKKNLKARFNEDIKGFHFYDVSFCFDNFTSGCKLAVCTDIRICHYSIGITNEQWEQRRAEFAEKNADKLPLKISRTYLSGDKINVLIGCLNFNGFTGSELYFLELAKELSKLNCNVSVCSNLGDGKLEHIARSYGIKCYTLQEPPRFRVGDGKWSMKLANGEEVVSKEKTLYLVEPINFDIIHASHKPIVDHLLKLYVDVPMISTVHSEIIELEYPVKHDSIKKYIAIRPEIKDFIVRDFDIEEEKVSVIYNPVDNNKFKPMNSKGKHPYRILFCGTIDYLRENVIKDLIQYTKDNNYELWLLGQPRGVEPAVLIGDNTHVKHFPPTNKVEDFIKECDETAGILLGRTTIESWMMGKPAWIYNVDNTGIILNKELFKTPDDIEKYYAKNVAKQIVEEYKKIID